MDGERFKSMLNEMLPREVIEEAIVRLGVKKRERRIDPVALTWATIFAGGTEDCGRLASGIRAYIEEAGHKDIARSAFYRWFDEEVQLLMRELSRRCCDYVERMPRHLPGILAGRRDWRAVDSTTVKLPKELIDHFRGTGDYASLKVHKVYSLGAENVVGYHLTEGRDHDGPQLQLDESWRGMGLLVDLGYASFQLLRDCRAYDVELVMRLKNGWNVYVDYSVDDGTKRTLLTGSDVDVGSNEDVRIDPTRVCDVDVTVGPEAAPIPMRLVGIPTDKGYLLFLTTLSRHTHSPDEVGTLYRLRWNIELDNKLGKSAFRLDQITARSPVSAEILVHASMMAATIANAFAHQDNLDRGYVGDKTPKLKEAPLHPLLVAKAIAVGAHRLAEMMVSPDIPIERWESLARGIRHLSKDPNWRRRPSVLDTVKGRRAPPGRPRKQRRST